jgi:DNA primase
LIPPDVITEVRDRTDVVAVVQESVPSLKRRGRSFVGLCPFHKEKTGSFHVNPDRGFFHCFGCKESGSVIDFVMKHDGYTFPEAVKMLAERLGIVIEEQSMDREALDGAARLKKQKDDLYAANHMAATFYEQQLREHPQRQYALDELARRGLVPGTDATADEALQAFRIGYAPQNGLARFLKAQGVSPVIAEMAGLLVPRADGTHYDRFRHRLMFAVVDPQGKVVAFSGRALADLPDTAHKDGPPAKYINSPESPVYTKGNALFGMFQARHAIRTAEVAVLVEGNFDVVSLHARGFQNVVAPLGTAFTVDQAKLLKRFAGDVVILFDGDAAGRKATRVSREACKVAGLGARVATLPDGVDPDDFARAKGVPALREVVQGACEMLPYLIDCELDETFASADIYEKAARVQRVAKLIGEETDPLQRMLAKSHADYAAGRLDIVRSGADAFRAVEDAVRKGLAVAPPRPVPLAPGTSLEPPRSARIVAKPEGSEYRKGIVAAIIEWPALLDDADVQSVLPLLEGSSAQIVVAVAHAVRVGNDGEKSIDPTVFLAQIPRAIHPFASERLAAPVHDSLSDARASLMDNAGGLRKLTLARQTDGLANEQRKPGKGAGDWDQNVELMGEAQEAARLRHGLKT